MFERLCNGAHAKTQRRKERKGFFVCFFKDFAFFASSRLRVSQLFDPHTSALRWNMPVMVAVSFLLSGTIQAATITVTTTTDGPVGDMPGGCSLRAAIAAANDGDSYDGCAPGSAGADEVVFDSALSGEVIVLSEGELNITNALTISGPVPGESVGITIDGNNQSRIFKIEGSQEDSFDVGLVGMTLTGGHTSMDSEYGGAIHAVWVNLNLDHVSVISNSTEGFESFGGGVAVEVGNVILTNSRVIENATSGGNSMGGGLFVHGGNLLMVDSDVSGNATKGDLSGGGGMIISGGDLEITDSTISDNSTTGVLSEGGGIRIFGGGFGVYDSRTTLTNTTVSGNSTHGERSDGGGLYNNCGETIVLNSTFSENSVNGLWASGAGLYVAGDEQWSTCGDTTLENTTVSDNLAQGEQSYGGGLLVFGSALTLTHVTVAFNKAMEGGGGLRHSPGIWGHRTAKVRNSLFVQSDEAEISCGLDSELSEIINTLATDDSCFGDVAGLGEIALRPLAKNGGTTRTHALREGSVAIDAAGDCFEDFGINQDQRGLSRPGLESSACDIGAYEFQNETIFRDGFEQESA